jgi:serine protease AprX
MGGSGGTDLHKVYQQLLKLAPIPAAPASSWGTGTGSIEAARGDAHVGDGTTDLTGEVDVFGQPWVGSTWAKADSGRTVWKGGVWRGETLAGNAWKDMGGGRKTWPTASWTQSGTTPTDAEWTSKLWVDDAWTSKLWRDGSWTSKLWRDDSWSSKLWRADDWD